MCVVQTPYYHECGHYGPPTVARNGRCARAEHLPGPCWETEDNGIRTIEAICLRCERIANDTANHAPLSTTNTSPIDVSKFNDLVKLHKETFAHQCSASDTGISSPIKPGVPLPTADELAFPGPGTTSAASVVSTSASKLSMEEGPPIIIANPPSPPPISRIPAWKSVEDWAKHAFSGESENL
ncbi:hypothetical protein E4T39_01806 [Aureobasidium subglaciale]|nr:hypothetical protein E4T39_01806 [Aureobasidium subglaciale]